MEKVDKYDLAEKELKGFTRSAVRTKVMLALRNGEMSAGDLERVMGIRSTTILHAIKEMNESGLVAKTSQGYSLTNIGKIQALLLDDLVTAIIVIDQHRDFWLTHDMSGIPEDLLVKIGMIGESKIISGDPAALLKAQEFFVEQLMNSESIHGVSPIIIPEYPKAIASAVLNGAEVDLILTEAIMKIVLEEHRRQITDLMSFDNFRLYKLTSNVKVAFTVIDSTLSLGLFRLDGGYDLGNDLICSGESAKNWGVELFEYYQRKSELLTKF